MSNTIKYGNDGLGFEPKSFDVGSNKTEEFRRELAFQTWGKFFETLGIRYYYKATASYRVKKFATEISYKYVDVEHKADFYLGDTDTFVLVRGYSFEEEREKRSSRAGDLTKVLDCSVVIAYADGRFRLVDYGDDSEAMSSDAALGRCPKCEELYFFTTNNWGGCRSCGHYNPKDKNVIVFHGKDGFLKGGAV